VTTAIRGALLTLCAGTLAFGGAPCRAHGVPRDQLRRIVQQQCVPDWLKARDPGPCVSVTLPGSRAGADGYAVLADIKGGAHYLLIPIASIGGIESPQLRAPDAFNYLAAAWTERRVLVRSVGHAVPRDAVGLAVNSMRARSQDQLHIHISCVRPAVRSALIAAESRIGASWSSMTLRGSRYHALRIMGRTLRRNPFALLADGVPGAAQEMGHFTMLVAGIEFREGPGFIVLAGSSVPGAELLLDPSCALAAHGERRSASGADAR